MNTSQTSREVTASAHDEPVAGERTGEYVAHPGHREETPLPLGVPAGDSEGDAAARVLLIVQKLLEAVGELRTCLETRRPGMSGDSEEALSWNDGTTKLLRVIERVGHSYEVVTWGVFMPHLLRNAPGLAPATVVELQENHQAEKKHLEVFYVHANAQNVDADYVRQQLRDNAGQLREVLAETLRLLSTEVSAAFAQLPADQQTALQLVVDHELRRQEGEDVPPDNALFVAADVLESDRPTIPTLRPPHAES